MIDVNLIKEKLPGYDPGIDPLFHDEGADIGGDLLLPRAIEEARHIIIEMTGKNSQTVVEIAQGLKEKGYRLEVYHISGSPLAESGHGGTRPTLQRRIFKTSRPRP